MKKNIGFNTDEGIINLKELIKTKLEQQYNISYDEIVLIQESEQDKIINNINKQRKKTK